MEVNINGSTYIVIESYGISDKEQREETVAEKLAGIIVRDKSDLQSRVKTT